MKLKLIILLVLQAYLSYGQIDNRNSLSSSMSFRIFNNENKKIVGSPYINDVLFPIKIEGYNEKKLKARYNAHQDYFEVLSNGVTKYFTVKSSLKLTFLNTDKVYAAFNKNDGGNEKTFYVIKYENPSFKILLKEQIILKDEIKAKTGYGSYTPPTFKRTKDIYFVKYNDSENVIEIPTKTKKFLKIVADKEKEMKRFIKNNKIELKKEKDLIKVFNYYTTLR